MARHVMPNILAPVIVLATLGVGTAILAAAFPGLAITITVVALNVLGDGLRDAFDPRVRGR